jgi:hypothetical protein
MVKIYIPMHKHTYNHHQTYVHYFLLSDLFSDLFRACVSRICLTCFRTLFLSDVFSDLFSHFVCSDLFHNLFRIFVFRLFSDMFSYLFFVRLVFWLVFAFVFQACFLTCFRWFLCSDFVPDLFSHISVFQTVVLTRFCICVFRLVFRFVGFYVISASM